MTMFGADVLGLAALVFALGLKHGFDPDHLVAIDGLTRTSKSRWCGLFFSLGHGLVVTLVGVLVAVAARDWRAPAWLEPAGASISVGVLLALGLGNLAVLARTPASSTVPLVGLRGRWIAERLARASHPAVIAGIGAAFALSFDTISHALVFSLTGASLAGWLFATMLGLVFTAGMVLIDALNGWWVARMISGADRRAAIASRWMSGAIALLCFALGAVGFARQVLPAVEREAAQWSPALSAATLLIVGAAYGLAVLRSRSAYREAGS